MRKKIINFIENNHYSFLIISSIIYELFIYLIYPFIEKDYVIFILSGFIFVFSIFLFLNDKKSFKKNLIYLIYTTGIILRTIYICKTGINVRQHDVLKIDDAGHLGYIYTIFKTHHLPLTNNWQFYHPPLWHFIGATWLHICSFFGINLDYSLEGIQIISLLFSSYIILIVDKICLKLKLCDKDRNIVDTLIAMHPFLIIMSGNINNDTLLIFLQFLIILLLFNYYENKNVKNIIYLAIVTGLSVMTKMNGALMAIPILFVFIKELIDIIKKDKSKIKFFFIKMIVFGIISLPIGLWYQIRNLIMFSSNKVPNPGDWLYTGNNSFISRFFSLDINQLLNFAKMDSDYNLPAFVIKSSLFGEFKYDNIQIIAMVITTVNTLLILVSILYMIHYLYKRKYNIYMNILLVTWVINIVSMIIFNIKYPYACSMDFRYIAICLLPGIIFLCSINNNVKNKYMRWTIQYFIFLFIFLSYCLSLII